MVLVSGPPVPMRGSLAMVQRWRSSLISSKYSRRAWLGQEIRIGAFTPPEGRLSRRLEAGSLGSVPAWNSE